MAPAWALGTRVVKAHDEYGDRHCCGALATIRKVVPIKAGAGLVYAYWVEWDDTPGSASFVSGHKLERVRNHTQSPEG